MSKEFTALELSLKRRKSYIRSGDPAFTKYAWLELARQSRLADKGDSLPDDIPVKNGSAVTEAIENVVPMDYSNNVENARSEWAAQFEKYNTVLSNLLVDISTIKVVGRDLETANIPNDLLHDNEDESREMPNNEGENQADQASVNCSKKKETFEKLLKCEDFHRVLQTSSPVTPAELNLMYLKLGLQNHLCHTGFCDFARMLNITIGEKVLPESRHLLDEQFNGIINKEYHALCHNCGLYLGKMDTAIELSQCSNCQQKLELTNPSSVNYFILFDPSESIKGVVEENEDYYYHVVNERQSEVNHIKDIFDGYGYKTLLSKLNADERRQYLTVNINTDGAPRFESSNYSIWPIYVLPNEVPVEHRRPILCGLWFGRHKPNMIPFLWPFVEAFNKLTRDGIECTIKGEKLKLKVFAACVSVDSSARAPLQGVKQYNGYFACNWCEQEGAYKNGVRYPYLDGDKAAPKRDPETMRRDMENAVKNGTIIKGVQSLSPLVGIKYFNIVDGFVVDYLHAALEGVGVDCTDIFETLFTPDDIYLLDQILLQIKAPHQISRLSRPFTERAQWKAREWENWVLYYSLPLLSLILGEKHPEKVQHWSYFVKSLHILLGSDITMEKLNEANSLLHRFVKYMQVVYKDLGLKPMKFNMHIMLHIVESVYNWGPLYTNSTFVFESGNMQVLQAIKCAKGVIQQVARYINLQYCLSRLEARVYPDASPAVKEFCDRYSVQKTFRLSDRGPVYFGTATRIGGELLEKLKLTKTRSRGYLKMVKLGCIYSSSRRDNARSCNYYAQLKNGAFIKIDLFVIDEQEAKEYTVCRYIHTEPFYHPIQIVKGVLPSLHRVATKKIQTICIYQKIDKTEYICPLPNLHHY